MPLTKTSIQTDLNNAAILGWDADIYSAQDYYAFGMTMPGRNYSAPNRYRYGFNGMEKDDDWSGKGNSYDFGARIYDSRLGRWLAQDPLKKSYPDISPYAFGMNNPILLVDEGGKFIKDKDGNLVVTDRASGGSFPGENRDGYYTSSQVSGSGSSTVEGSVTTETSIQAVSRSVWVYTNKGIKVEAQVFEGYYKVTRTVDSKTGDLTYKTEEVELEDKSIDKSTQCHGYSLTKGAVSIENDRVQKVLDSDYEAVDGTESADIVVFDALQEGNEADDKYEENAHSARVNSNGTYSDNAGSLTTQENVSLEDVKRGFEVVKTQYYKHKGDKKIDVDGQAIGKNGGVVIVNENEISKIVNNGE